MAAQSTSDATQALPPPEWDDPQAQLLEDTWVLTLFAVLLAAAVPWFVSSLNIDFAAASWAVLALGLCYLAMSLLAAERAISPWRRRLVALLHAAGVIGLGFLWHACGGLQNPAFLLAFALPVIGASALSRGQPYLTAVLSLLVVGAVGLIEAPELRWYVVDLRTAGRWLAPLAPLLSPTAGAAGGTFAGFYAPVGYDVTLLEVFSILLLACAVASESLGYAFQRLIDHLTAARAEGAQAQQLWAMLLQQLPAPALLVDSETLQVLVASERFSSFLGASIPPVGRSLPEALPISYPERLQELVTGHGGRLTIVLKSPERLRLAQLQVQQLLSDGRRLALLLLEDNTTAYCISAALDADEHATLVIDAEGRVLASNQPARALFPGALPGSDATGVLLPLAPAGGASRWWEPGLAGRRRLQLSVARRRYQAVCSAVALPGEEQGLYVIALAPAWLGAGATQLTESLMSEVR
ncbi:MAG TPA: hypothetical protein VID71_09860 [Steroidobacteraceae bacterium]|jgi:hypothetical protein